jgi:hypothetical protein
MIGATARSGTPMAALPPSPDVLTSLTSAPVLIAALVGAGAALGGQIIAQIGTGYFKANERRIREDRVLKVFQSRVRMVAASALVCLKAVSEDGVSQKTAEKYVKKLQEYVDELARDVDNTELLLSLAPDFIEVLGTFASGSFEASALCESELEKNSQRAPVGSEVLMDAKARVEILLSLEIIVVAATRTRAALKDFMPMKTPTDDEIRAWKYGNLSPESREKIAYLNFNSLRPKTVEKIIDAIEANSGPDFSPETVEKIRDAIKADSG